MLQNKTSQKYNRTLKSVTFKTDNYLHYTEIKKLSFFEFIKTNILLNFNCIQFHLYFNCNNKYTNY